MNFPNLSRQLAAQAWCKPTTAKTVMDPVLAEAFAEILDEQMSQPSLGCATTKQLLDEIAARVDLTYSTVFSERIETKTPLTNTERKNAKT